MRTLLNVIWLILCGWWMALIYAVAGIICFVLIITIPFGIAAFRIADYVLWPFGRTIVARRDAGLASLIGNVIWIAGVRALAGTWPPDRRHHALPDDHRDTARPGQLQIDPDLAGPAGHPHRARRSARTDPSDGPSIAP